MVADDNTELLPVMAGGEPSFDTAMRGYDRRQVDDYVARLEADVLDISSARDLALSVSAERAAQLASTQAHIESLEQSLSAAKTSQTIDIDNVDELVTGKLVGARAEAAEIVQAARLQAEQIRQDALVSAGEVRAAATAEASRITDAARADAERDRLESAARIEQATTATAQRTAEAEQRMAQARMQAVSELDSARAEAESLLAVATAERDRLDAESLATREEAELLSNQRRQLAEEDFEITLRARRSAAEQQARTDLEATRTTVAAMVAAAESEVAVLQSHRDELHAALVDFHTRVGTVVSNTAP
jgi:DivIVA domain-containing protein